MRDTPDTELLASYRSGDAHALEVIFERYEAPVYQFLVGVLRDYHLAEDVLQETFVRALQRLEGVDPEHLRGWLFTVAYQQAMLTRRRQKTVGQPASPLMFDGFGAELADPCRGPGDEAEQHEEASRVRALLELLPAPQREVIRRRVYEGKRFREIATELECPLNTALARMHEGLKRLRLLWEQSHA